MTRTVLLTAFEPFGGETVNPSALVQERVRAPAGVHVERLVLPVSFAGALELLESALHEYRPSLTLALGQAGGRAAVSLERVALNLKDARLPDNDGAQPIDAPIVPGGPAAYFSTLPLKGLLGALHHAGIPAHLSASAGLYVCNAVMYGLLHHLARFPGARGGFVHLPYLPEQAARVSAPSMDLGLMVRAVECCLEACMTGAPQPAFAAGDPH